MSRSRTITGTVTTAVLVIGLGNQVVTEWVNDQFRDETVLTWFMRQLTWPNWMLSTTSQSSLALRNLIATDLRALLVISLVGGLLHLTRRKFPEGVGGFFLGWSTLIFASAMAAFVAAFAISDPSVLNQLVGSAGAAVYGLFVGWIVGIATYRKMPVSATRLIEALGVRSQSLAVAESVTGGLLAAAIVDVPGASHRLFRGGVVIHVSELEASLGLVPADVLTERGPVDEVVAVALAEGIRRQFGADWGLATVGVAGPHARDGIVVGTVYVAVAGPSPDGRGATDVRFLALTGEPARVRADAVVAALDLLRKHLGDQ